jgi:lipopolysaccharide transport system permease protein
MSELPCTVYTSASQLRHPGVLARQMVSDLINSRELAWRLFVRDISAQYRQSVLGYIWVFIPPLVASLPFIYLNSQGVVRFGHTPIPYAAYAGIGAIVWQTFVDALNAPLRAVVAAKPVLTRVNLPREAILLSALAQVGLGVLVRLPLLIGFMVLFHIAPPVTALLFPIGLLSLILFGFVIGLLLTPLGVLYGDVQQILPVATTFLMLLTPVVYPQPHSGLAAAVAALNPLTPLITTTRDWLTVGATGNMTAFLAITAGALLCLLAGWVGVRVAMPHLIARIGS